MASRYQQSDWVIDVSKMVDKDLKTLTKVVEIALLLQHVDLSHHHKRLYQAWREKSLRINLENNKSNSKQNRNLQKNMRSLEQRKTVILKPFFTN